ncbi:MAG: hypothetical protein G8D58_10580 [gamma proteobacterium symbiont of Phacoides pectinatus]
MLAGRTGRGAAGADSPTIKDDVMRAQLLLSALLPLTAMESEAKAVSPR